MNGLICIACHCAVESFPNERGGTWSCPCGRSHGAWLKEGALDIGGIHSHLPGVPCDATCPMFKEEK